MTSKDIYKNLGGLDPELILRAEPAEREQIAFPKDGKMRKKSGWRKWTPLAACFLLIMGAVMAVYMLRERDPNVIPGGVPGVIPEPGTSIVLPSPPAYSSYDFESYKSTHSALTNPLSPKFIQLRVEQKNCGETYRQTLSDFASGRIQVAVPQVNGENIPLRNREGFNNVTWFTSELYNLPWLWYHCVVGEQNLTVCIAYLSVLDRSELDSATSYYQVLKLISPNSPSPDNYQESESYEEIYEKEITLGDGRKATAMISELKDDSRIYVSLYLDGMLVTLRGDGALLTEDFLRTFSMAYME